MIQCMNEINDWIIENKIYKSVETWMNERMTCTANSPKHNRFRRTKYGIFCLHNVLLFFSTSKCIKIIYIRLWFFLQNNVSWSKFVVLFTSIYLCLCFLFWWEAFWLLLLFAGSCCCYTSQWNNTSCRRWHCHKPELENF